MYNYKTEKIYIAGPECFYPNGYALWDAMGNKAKYYGFGVTMPTSNHLDLSNEDLCKNADTIFANCIICMNESTAIIADLEAFRGSEPDGGTLFEIGMAYARGIRCYGFTRDMRDMVSKHQAVTLKDGIIYDNEGRVLPYQDIPFCPSLIGSCKLIQGGFDDALRLLMLDINEERKAKAKRQTPPVNHSTSVTITEKPRPLAYLSGPERFDPNAAEQYENMKALCLQYGFDAVSPLDPAIGVEEIVTDDSYTKAYNIFDRCQQHVRNCDLILANLSDFHGFEPNSDTSFECGMAWQLGKKCYGHMPDASSMRDRIPQYGVQGSGFDIYGNVVENFNYPINLMFASSMSIYEGNLETILQKAAKDFS